MDAELRENIYNPKKFSELYKRELRTQDFADSFLDMAIEVNSFKIIEFLITEGGADIHYKNDKALLKASGRDNIKEIEFYLQYGAHITDDIFIEACDVGNPKIVLLLIDHKANLTKDALFKACSKGHAKVVKLLLEKGLDIFIDNGEALLYGCQSGNLDMINFLLDHKVIQQIDKAFINMCQTQHYNIIDRLLNKGADINYNSSEALTYSAKNSINQLMNFLLEHKAVINNESLILVCSNLNLEGLKLLVFHGADVNLNNGELLLILVEKSNKSRKNLELLDFLLQNNIDIHAGDDAALHLACQMLNLPLVIYLLNHQADINAKDSEALRIAIRKQSNQLVNFLLSKGATFPSDKDKLLEEAYTINYSFEMRELLRNNGAVIRDKDKFLLKLIENNEKINVYAFFDEEQNIIVSDKDLLAAYYNNNLTILSYLIAKGGDINFDNAKLLTLAISENNDIMAKFLIENGINITNNTQILKKVIEAEDLNLILLLIEKGINIYNNIDDLINLALKYNNLDLIKIITKKGIVISNNIIDSYNLSPEIIQYLKRYTKKPIYNLKPKKEEKTTDLHFESNFVKWYLENYQYFIAGEQYVNFDFQFYLRDNNLTNYKYEKISMLELYQKNPELYRLYFSHKVPYTTNIVDYAKILSEKINISQEDIISFILTVSYNFINEICISENYIDDQINFVKHLSEDEKTLLKWYSYTGDRVINSYLRFNYKNNLDKFKINEAYTNILKIIKKINYPKPSNMEDIKVKYILIYNFIIHVISVINNIIAKSPKNKHPFIVYQYAEKANSLRSDSKWENLGFYSTTLIDTRVFPLVLGKENIYKSYIIVPANTPCLFLSVSEFIGELEIIFPYNNCFKELKPFEYIDEELIKIENRQDMIVKYYNRVMIYDHQGSCDTSYL